MLTKRQKQLLEIIKAYSVSKGICPSYDDMLAEMGLRSKSGINRLVKALEARGFIRRLPNFARAIEVVRMPDDYFAATIGDATYEEVALIKALRGGDFQSAIGLVAKIAGESQ